MKKDKKTILVPWDFDGLSEHALEHAVLIANKTENDIALIHITHKKNTEDIKDRLEEVAAKCEQEEKIRPFCIVKRGHFSKVMKQTITELRCYMVVTKTDGVRTKSTFDARNLMKLIAWSNIPIIVIQDPPKSDNIQT